MKRKALKRSSSSSSRRENKMKKGSLARHLTVQLGQVSFIPIQHHQTTSSSLSLSHSTRFHNLLDSEATGSESHPHSSITLNVDVDSNVDERDFILSQDFFCTPDYITPDAPNTSNNLDIYKENIPCPKSPEKQKTGRSKRQREEFFSDSTLENSFSFNLSTQEELVELSKDTPVTDEIKIEKTTEFERNHSYVSQSAVALRCRVMPPPCLKNPYLKDASEIALDDYGNMRSKCAGFFPAIIGGDGLSRYRTDFHEIEQIGSGNFSRVFKVLKRIDGCAYAVKQSTRQLHQDTERRKALMEVQALAALGSHENIVGYYSSWFENEQLYIQMELCDHSLPINKLSKLSTEGEVLGAMHQIVKALEFIHDRGIAHLDVKPDNIYIKNGIYKLGDFGCATLLDKSLPIEEGDARYMPQEILNDNYDHLDKVDIFSLGAAIFELIRGSALPESGPLFLNLREGKLPLLPGHSVQFQNLLKAMMDPDPIHRPSAKELAENPVFDRVKKTMQTR